LQDEDAFDDLLWSVDEIAAYIKRPIRQTYWLIQTKQIPTTKVGAIHTARKSKLRARLLGDDGGRPAGKGEAA
jgi:hypothetical protein